MEPLKDAESQSGLSRNSIFKFLSEFLYVHKILEVFETLIPQSKKRNMIICSSQEMENAENPLRTTGQTFGQLGAQDDYYMTNLIATLTEQSNKSSKPFLNHV